MKDNTYSVIDVGTNNILLLIARRTNGEISVLNRKSSISALGKNMKNGLLTTSGIYRTKVILKDFITYSRLFTDKIIIVGTSCSRESKNISEISNWLKKRFSITYHILSGEDEARLNGLANIHEFRGEKEFLLFDVGGGSTEFTLIRKGNIEYFKSLKLGIRRLQNKYGNNKNRKIQRIRSMLKEIDVSGKVVVGIGGTATSLAAMKFNLEKYNPQIVHKCSISRSELEQIISTIINLNKRQIARLLPFDPFRSDIIATGAMIIHEILDFLDADNFFVSDRGLQFGIIMEDESRLVQYAGI